MSNTWTVLFNAWAEINMCPVLLTNSSGMFTIRPIFTSCISTWTIYGFKRRRDSQLPFTNTGASLNTIYDVPIFAQTPKKCHRCYNYFMPHSVILCHNNDDSTILCHNNDAFTVNIFTYSYVCSHLVLFFSKFCGHFTRNFSFNIATHDHGFILAKCDSLTESTNLQGKSEFKRNPRFLAWVGASFWLFEMLLRQLQVRHISTLVVFSMGYKNIHRTCFFEFVIRILIYYYLSIAKNIIRWYYHWY
jgi:hypothetical protein